MNLPLPFSLHTRRWVIGGLALAAASAWGADQTVTAASADPAIELPKFEVTDSRVLPPPQSWRYASVPGFEILSSISKRETTRFVRDFLFLQAGINEIMPGFISNDVAVPANLILTGRGKDFERFLPVDRTDELYTTNGLFFDDPERGVIIVDFALSEIQLEDNTVEEADPYRSFYKDYFRSLIRRQVGSKAPPWFEEGLVQIFAAIDVNKKWINFAQIGDGFGGERTGDFNTRLAQHALLPIPELMAENPQRGTFWEAQCYAFVHMCLYGRGQKYQKGFVKFISRMGREAPNEQFFKECFGMGFKDMNLELRGYVGFTDYKSQQFRAKKGQSLPEPPPFELRDATDAESGRIVGEALRLGQHNEEAHNALIAPYIRGERDPLLLAALGLDERRAGNNDRAKKFLEAAVKVSAARPRAFLELGRLRLEEARATPGAPNDKLSDAQVTQIFEPLLVARKQRPPMAAVYGAMAETWMRSATPPTREQFLMVVEGVQTFPRSTQLLLQATLMAANTFPKEALQLAEFGRKTAKDDATRTQFETLERAFQRDAAPEPAPAPTPVKSESYLPKLP